LATIAEVKSKYAQSRWKKDAEALELEVKQSSGQKPILTPNLIRI